MGFFVICAGVVLLQLSKSAKDVPDAAVFSGDLDQVRTIAEQAQSETEPQADAIRGAAAIVRRFSTTREKRELDEAKRLHEEKQQDLEPIGENEHVEWDGLRRRRTTYGSNSVRSRGNTTPFPDFEATHTPQPHPPLGMSQFPTESDSDVDEEQRRPDTGNSLSFFQRAKSIVGPRSRNSTLQQGVQSPMHPVPLTEISIPAYKGALDSSDTAYYGREDQGTPTYGPADGQKTEYQGADGQRERHITIVEDRAGSSHSLHPHSGPTPPPHSARRQFSFQNVFRKGQGSDEAMPPSAGQSRSPMIRKGLGDRARAASVSKGATEEERLGLVKGDTNTGRMPTLPTYEDEESEEAEDWLGTGKARLTESPDRGPRRDLTPPRRDEKAVETSMSSVAEEEYYRQQRKNWDASGKGTGRALPPPPPPGEEDRPGSGRGSGGAFI